MSWRTMPVGLAIATCLTGIAPAPAAGQGWAIELSGGQVVYDPVSTSIDTASVVGTIRYDAARGAWVYGSVAPALDGDDPFWGAFGAGGRFVPAGSGHRRVRVGLDTVRTAICSGMASPIAPGAASSQTCCRSSRCRPAAARSK
jgi:hypothetical protein